MDIKQSRKEVDEHLDSCVQILDAPDPGMSTFWWFGFASMSVAGAFTAISGVSWLGTVGWIGAMYFWYKIGTLTRQLYKTLVATSAMKAAILHLAMEAREQANSKPEVNATEEVPLH